MTRVQGTGASIKLERIRLERRQLRLNMIIAFKCMKGCFQRIRKSPVLNHSDGQDRKKCPKLQQLRFRVDIVKTFSTVRIVGYYKRSPRRWWSLHF